MLFGKNVVVVITSLAVIVGFARFARADGEKGTAVIKGQVLLEGEAPKLKAVKMSGDAFCVKGKAKPVPGLRVWKDGTVPYVFVYVKKGISGKYPAPAEPAKLDQKGCMYRPHVFGMVAGQALQITNGDPTSHNVHALPKKNTEFNFSQPSQGMSKDMTGRDTFTKPEVMIRFKCDVHSWMEAYCGVLPHPFFDVTGKPGTFEIKGLPAGEYELEAWHERFGKVTATVKVGDGETKEIELKLPGSKKTASADLVTRTIMLGSLVAGDGTLAESCCDQGAGGAGE
jgi:hypothetical protein